MVWIYSLIKIHGKTLFELLINTQFVSTTSNTTSTTVRQEYNVNLLPLKSPW